MFKKLRSTAILSVFIMVFSIVQPAFSEYRTGSQVGDSVAYGAGGGVIAAGVAAVFLTFITGGAALPAIIAAGAGGAAVGGYYGATEEDKTLEKDLMVAGGAALGGVAVGGATVAIGALAGGAAAGGATTAGGTAAGGAAAGGGSAATIASGIGSAAAGGGVIAASQGGTSSTATYNRPYIRSDVRSEVERLAPKNANGQFLDANTGNPINGQYDLGHKAGHEFWREAEKAKNEGLTQKQFNERMNNPDIYQIEDPHENRSHVHEQH